jgi:hypothetical protein
MEKAAASNFLGAVLLSRLFDTVGRVRMISGTYLISGILLAITGVILGSLTAVTLTPVWRGDLLLLRLSWRELGVSHAERDLPHGDSGAVHRLLLRRGTAAGGITGPLLFGSLIQNASDSGDITKIAVGYFIGAALMIVGGFVEAIFGVKAERQSLEDLAKPLTAEDAPEKGATASKA